MEFSLRSDSELLPCPCGDSMVVYSTPSGGLHTVVHQGTPCPIGAAPKVFEAKVFAIQEWNSKVLSLRNQPHR